MNYDVDPKSWQLLGNIENILQKNEMLQQRNHWNKVTQAWMLGMTVWKDKSELTFWSSMENEQDTMVDNLLIHAQNL